MGNICEARGRVDLMPEAPESAGGQMELYFTDAAALAAGRGTDVRSAHAEQLRYGRHQRMPFILDGEYRPLRDVNRWLRQLPVTGSSSANSWEAYARDMLAWARFLDARGSGVRSASDRDLAAYYALRRAEGPLGQRLSPASWNRLVAALSNFYDWALADGLVSSVPFTRRVGTAMVGGQMVRIERNMAKERNARAHAHIKWLERDRLLMFFRVGLNGLLPDGSPDERFRGRQFARNRALGELMASTGLRHAEAAHLMACEVPEIPGRARSFVRWSLPPTICKGRVGRTVWVTPAALQAVHGYIRMERSIAAEGGRYKPVRPLLASELGSERGLVDGRRRRWATLSVADRELLVCGDGSSPLLTLSSDGSPLLDYSDVFAAATERCRRFLPDFPTVTPHTLRHTFAVHMLRWLLERAVEAVVRRREDTRTDLYAGWWRMHDPLRVLQQLMGHAQVTTTELYLDAIDATQLYADAAEGLADA